MCLSILNFSRNNLQKTLNNFREKETMNANDALAIFHFYMDYGAMNKRRKIAHFHFFAFENISNFSTFQLDIAVTIKIEISKGFKIPLSSIFHSLYKTKVFHCIEII